MGKEKKSAVNLYLPIEMANNLRMLSNYRKFKGVDNDTMSDIVIEALDGYLKDSKQFKKAQMMFDDDDSNTVMQSQE